MVEDGFSESKSDSESVPKFSVDRSIIVSSEIDCESGGDSPPSDEAVAWRNACGGWYVSNSDTC